MRYQVEPEKRNSISPSNHVLLIFVNYIHVLYINTVLTTRTQLYSFFKMGTQSLLFTHGTKYIVSDLPAADWPSQIHMKNYCNFPPVEIPFEQLVLGFSFVIKIKIKIL